MDLSMRAGTRWAAALAVAACLVGGGAVADEPAEMLAEARNAFDRKGYKRAVSLARRVIRRHADSGAAEEAYLVLIDGLPARATAWASCGAR